MRRLAVQRARRERGDHLVFEFSGIDELAVMAAAEKDHATASMLKWFIDEQVEEELSTDTIVQKLKLIGTNTGGLFMLDHELGERKAK
jgi:ferritin